MHDSGFDKWHVHDYSLRHAFCGEAFASRDADFGTQDFLRSIRGKSSTAIIAPFVG